MHQRLVPPQWVSTPPTGNPGSATGYNSGYSRSGQQTGNSSSVHKVGNAADVQCLLCGLKGHKVTTCRKLPRAQELIKQDK